MKPIFTVLAAVAVLSFAGAPAHAQSFKELMEDIGIQKRKTEKMDFSERAPLVLPPTVDTLPPPEEAAVGATANPQWPQDPDVLKAQKEAEDAAIPDREKRKFHESPSEAIYEMRRQDKEREYVPTGKEYGSALDDHDRRLSIDELKKVKREREAAAKSGLAAGATPVVMTEPERKRLTDPPPGYRVPAPDQPYGPGETDKKGKGQGGVFSKLNPFK